MWETITLNFSFLTSLGLTEIVSATIGLTEIVAAHDLIHARESNDPTVCCFEVHIESASCQTANPGDTKAIHSVFDASSCSSARSQHGAANVNGSTCTYALADNLVMPCCYIGESEA